MKIPVVILNYNSSSDCRKCVSFLKKQKGVDIEIILVDNCSKEYDLTSLRKLAEEQGCTLLESKENRGYNAGNNIGLRYAVEKDYKYALIANPDMEFPQSHYIASLAQIMEQDEQIAVCASDVVTPEGLHQNPLRELGYYEELFWPITILRNRKNGNIFIMDSIQSGYCDKVSGCCFMICLSFVKKIGFFDENVFLYSEEPILAKQVQYSNRKMYYLSTAQSIHRHIKSEKGNSKPRMRALMTSRKYYLRNYSGFSQIKLMIMFASKTIEKWFVELFVK